MDKEKYEKTTFKCTNLNYNGNPNSPPTLTLIPSPSEISNLTMKRSSNKTLL